MKKRTKKNRVLMLGWEFPPFFNGGLGVACQNICLSLQDKVELTLLVPNSGADTAYDYFKIIDVIPSYIEHFDIKKEKTEKFKTVKIKTPLFPYQSPEQEVFLSDRIIEYFEKGKRVFKLKNLYGADLIQNVERFARKTNRLIKMGEHDIIHAHDWMTFPAATILKKKLKIPLVLHVHSTEVDRNGLRDKGIAFLIEKEAFELADRIITVSYYTSQVIQDFYGISKEKITPIHNGIESNPLTQLSFDVDKKANTVLFLGRVTSQKGPEFFVDAASKILEKKPETQFILAGSGDRLAPIIERIAALKLGEKFHITGFLTSEKVKEIYTKSDVYFMPSVSEPFGLTALEAAMHGLPCVVSKQSGITEVLPSAEAVDFWNVNGLAEAVVKLLDSPKEREKQVIANYAVISNYTWTHCADKIEQVYTQLI